MSAIYGFSSTISNGNTADQVSSAMNRQIDSQNSLARDNFSRLRTGEKENKLVAESNLAQTDIKDRADEGQEGGKVMSAVNDLTAKRTGTSISTSKGQEAPEEVNPEVKPQGDSFEMSSLRSNFIKNGGEAGANEGEIFAKDSDSIQSVSSKLINSISDLKGSKNIISDGLKSVGTEGGVLGSGLSGALKGATILTGGYDLVKDIGDKGYFSNLGGKGLTADKVSNVAGVVSGGLETAGLVADATGVGAIVGVPLQALGLIAGGVGLVSGLMGDIKDEGSQKSAVSIMPTIKSTATAPQQSQTAFTSAFQGGQLIQ